MKQKIAASLGAAPEEEELVDDGTDATRIEPSQQTPAVIRSKTSGEQQQRPSRMSTPSIRSAQSKRLFDTEEAILAGIQERTSVMMTMRDEYLERQRGKDRERETLVEWIVLLSTDSITVYGDGVSGSLPQSCIGTRQRMMTGRMS